jgi:hypothetical protein
MNKYAFPATILASIMTTSASAQPMSQVCNTLPCIYDHNNKIVGIPVAIGNAIRQVNGKWYMVNLTKSGIEISDNFFYFLARTAPGRGLIYTIPDGYHTRHHMMEILFMPQQTLIRASIGEAIGAQITADHAQIKAAVRKAAHAILR